MPAHFVFGYGSLAAWPSAGLPGSFVAELRGRRRCWGVAMDNRRDLPGYKYYTDPGSGERPAVFVAFLDIAVDGPGAAVTGLCLPVDEDRLRELDRRERNYKRIEVTRDIVTSASPSASASASPSASASASASGSAPAGADGEVVIWAYAGSAAGRARLEEGRRQGTAVIDALYRRGVEEGFRALGEAAHRACLASLQPGELPVRELRRHELPE